MFGTLLFACTNVLVFLRICLCYLGDGSTFCLTPYKSLGRKRLIPAVGFRILRSELVQLLLQSLHAGHNVWNDPTRLTRKAPYSRPTFVVSIPSSISSNTIRLGFRPCRSRTTRSKKNLEQNQFFSCTAPGRWCGRTSWNDANIFGLDKTRENACRRPQRRRPCFQV